MFIVVFFLYLIIRFPFHEVHRKMCKFSMLAFYFIHLLYLINIVANGTQLGFAGCGQYRLADEVRVFPLCSIVLTIGLTLRKLMLILNAFKHQNAPNRLLPNYQSRGPKFDF